MKLLIGADTYYPEVNGCSYFAQRLATGLSARGHEVHVVCPSRSLGSTRTSRGRVVVHGVPSLPIVLNRPYRFASPPLAYRSVLNVALAVQPDVVHVQAHFFVGRSLIRVARTLGIPIVATNHFMPNNLVSYLPLPGTLSNKVGDWLWWDFARVFNQVETITTPTPTAARLIRARGITRRVTPVSCGIDLTIFRPAIPSQSLRERLGVPPRPTYLYVGRLDKEKRIHELIEALPLIRRKVDAQLVIAGIGNEGRALEELASRLGVRENVLFAGFIPDEDLPALYAVCEVFCTASTAELQSIVTMEAMATGLPVVAVDAVALPHLVRSGVNGYTYQPGDVPALACHLVELLSDSAKRERMGGNSLKIVADHNIEQTLSTYEHMYERAISVQCHRRPWPSQPASGQR